MRNFLLFAIALVLFQANAQNYTSQDMTLQLDENGEATLIPEDVLINTRGTLWGVNFADQFLQFEYDQETQSMNFIDVIPDLCLYAEINPSYDRNPINKQEFLSGTIIDAGDIFSPYTNIIGCDLSQSKSTVSENVCNYYWGPPMLFSFDADGILYATNYDSFDRIYTFDPSSNISSLFADLHLDPLESGLTYDFENHRLIATDRSPNNDISFIEIDIETGVWNILFEIPEVNDCRANAIEYIGDDIAIMGSNSSLCKQIFSINLVTQEITLLETGHIVSDFLFIEDEIPDATLSTTQFTCDDLGEQTVDITVIENGMPVNYQATVNVVSDFSVRNCPIYNRLTTPDPNGSSDAVLGDFTSFIEVVSSCSSSFTITQDPPPGTLIPYGETETVLITVTDEFGDTAFCQITVCSDSILGLEDQSLVDNFIIYPIPTSDQVIIENINGIPVSKVDIMDINGRLLSVQEIHSAANTISLSFASYSSGMYFVRIATEDDILVKRIIKE